ncbi:hypothetical protein [Flavobacterium sp. LB2P44]
MKISTEIDPYNAFAKYCDDNTVVFINTTDINQQGLANKSCDPRRITSF